tara:strand:- start:1297 stop:1512 length:216 start_codon:yes stop_codon:yes gene_type:complete
MSAVQIKNLQRRLDNISNEAVEELDRACGSNLWMNIGFDAFDGMSDLNKRATANYYYGQWQTAREIKDCLN